MPTIPSVRTVAAEFDEISAVYDETRDPLTPATLDALAGEFHRLGFARVLEVGVGTGRIAAPLSDRRLRVTGIDVSRGMLRRARAKGIDRLVRGTVYRLPFADGVVDAVLFVHVLHLLDAPADALREAIRVGRGGAFGLVHPSAEGGVVVDPPDELPRRLLTETLAEMGYPSALRRASPWTKERALLAALPPDRLLPLGEGDVTVSLRDRLDRLARRGHRNLLSIPPEALARAVERTRERIGDQTATVHRVESLAVWTAPHGPVADAAG